VARRLLFRALMNKLMIIAALGAVPLSFFGVKSVLFTPSPSVVHLDFVERAAEAKAVTTSLDLVVGGDPQCSEATLHRRGGDFEVQICRDGGSASEPILRFKVAAMASSSSDAFNNRLFKLSSAVHRGKARVLSKIVDSDGAEAALLARLE
jgi:hypothetical protein